MGYRRLTAALAALALLAPASALAQSAGDEQYQDPFGGDDQQQSSSGSSGGDSSSGSAGTTAQATPTPSPAAAAPVATTAQQSTPAAQELPRTGGDPILPAAAGFWLLLGGVALRARLRLDDRRA